MGKRRTEIHTISIGTTTNGGTTVAENLYKTLLRKRSFRNIHRTPTSFGLTMDDSLLHGLNECIERHYLSLLFLALLDIHHNTPWWIADPKSSKSLSKKKLLELRYGGEALTLITKTKFGPYFSASLLCGGKESFLLSPIGSGCSSFLDLAIARSIDELNQCLRLYDAEALAEAQLASELFEVYPKLKRLKIITKSQIEDIAEEKMIPSTDILFPSSRIQVNRIVKNLRQYGYSPLYRVLKAFDQDAVVTQVFIPGFERFHLIRSGLAVSSQLDMEAQ